MYISECVRWAINAQGAATIQVVQEGGEAWEVVGRNNTLHAWRAAYVIKVHEC